MVTTERAAAERDCGDGEYVEDGGGDVTICVTDPGGESSGGSGGSGGGGSAEPTCDHLDAYTAANPGHHEYYCQGENACWENDPPFGFEDTSKWPDPPSPDAGNYIFRWCEDANGNITYQDFTWENEVEEPPLEEQAETAFGELDAPSFTLAFNPPGEAVIYIETWLWADDAPSGNLEGSSAFGLVAIAQPDHLEVDPGDGSDTITCSFATTKSDACAHTYERVSGDGGYPARARLVYDVSYEDNGAPVDIPGAPDTLNSQWQERAIPVTEVQSNVVR
ncbi:hypothetical protein [Streptomyces sp. 6N223]|uniref:hypothetical protein n=1 Tax=Streptomyces sp. 6N223 TaxID=3457412 RepID=UPI003FD0C248